MFVCVREYKYYVNMNLFIFILINIKFKIYIFYTPKYSLSTLIQYINLNGIFFNNFFQIFYCTTQNVKI